MLLNMLGFMQIELGPAKVPEAGLYLYASRIMNKCLAARQPPEKKNEISFSSDLPQGGKLG